MLELGHAAHFPIFPSIPKPEDWNRAVNAAKEAWEDKRGQWHTDSGGPNVLLAYEFRAVMDLALPLLKATKRNSTTKTWFETDVNEGLAERANLEAAGWTVTETNYSDMVSEAFSRHCINISNWQYAGVQEYHTVEPWARLWVWPNEIDNAKNTLGIG